ncbi:hypothetical protein BCR32DRAFT_325233 [Anaeromyces robustus]|uniref:DUF1648 domain-containing protein n=1 Tax=Anaeromyces robustus TaxID=1754192 RepID=A0A1Y1XJJ0_9FUNG|nr:hypothetical protein BCR32DRAFT_325233 [Anaeromyces robustus]|eukprot:ORX85931.1 hypothetical protein BCR32DRAFT_325233 [Anaeromyces robustus]
MAVDIIFTLHGINIFIIVKMVTEILTKWDKLPERIPSFNNPETTSSKQFLFVIPGATIIAFILLLSYVRSPPKFIIPIVVTNDNIEKTVLSVRTYLLSIGILLNSYMYYASNAFVNNLPVKKSISYIFLGIAFVATTIYYKVITRLEVVNTTGNKGKPKREVVNGRRINNKKHNKRY